jgi:ABC-type polar amino acid transport system ATPase subunit
MLKIENFNKKINNQKILDNFNLEVPHGHIAILLGSSGVGKSTFLRALNNLETLDSGKVILDNQTIDLKTINKRLISGLVFQNFNLFENMTVQENITFILEKTKKTNRNDAQKTALKLLEKYSLLELKDKYPGQLSGGQKQRLAIARATSIKPKIICLDEPTSALDPQLTNVIAELINDLANQNYIVIVTTHDISLVKKLNGTIHLMKSGKITESADTNNIWNNPEDYIQISKFIKGNKD